MKTDDSNGRPIPLDERRGLSPIVSFDGRALLWGRPRDRARHWRVFVGGFFAFTLGLWLLSFLDPDANTHAPTALALVVFLSIVVGTFVAAALSATAGGGIVHSLAVGLVPGIVIVLTGLGRDLLESSLTAPHLREIALVFSVLGLVGVALALAGFVAVAALDWLGSTIVRPNR